MKMSFKAGLFLFLLTTAIATIPRNGLATVSNTTVSTTTAYGDGSTTNFVIGFDFRDNSWIVVTEYDTSTSPTTVTVIPYGSGAGKYTISGGDPGTTVVMGTAPTTTQYLVITRDIPLTQPVVFSAAGIFPYVGISNQLDQMTLEIQNLNAIASGDTGTVSSVGMTVPSGLSISGSPITSTGTLALSWSGTVPNAQIPDPSSGSLGGIESYASVSHQWINTISTSGVPSSSQPSFSDISGTLGTSAGGTGATSFTSGLPLIGNGTSAVSTGTVSGNTTEFATTTGSLTSGDCVELDASGNFVDAGAACGSGGGGITALTGDVTASGSGSVAATLAATSNSTLTTLSALTSASSLSTVGTIGTGTWEGTKIGAAYGGTAIDTSSSTGVPSVSSGTWSVASDLATSLGGLGGNFGSSTGALSISGGTVSAGTLGYSNGGTNATTANGAMNNLAPTQATHVGEFLQTTGSNTQWAQPTQGWVNQLTNAGFDGATYDTGWTESGSGTPSKDATNFHGGTQSALMTTSSNTGCFYQDVTPSIQLSSTNLEFGAWVKTSATDVQVCEREAGSSVQCSAVQSTGAWQYVPVNGIGPASGSIGVSVCNTGNNTETFNVDDAYVGPARNLSQVSQAQSVGTSTWNGASSCSWTTTATIYSDFSANTNCGAPIVTGSLSAPATKLLQTIDSSAAPGTYTVTFTGSNYPGVVGSDTFYYLLTDENGTQTGIQAVSYVAGSYQGPLTLSVPFTYTTTATHTWRIQCVTSGSGTCGIDDASGMQASFSVSFTPSQQQAGYRPDATPASWSGYQSFSSGWSTSSSVLVAPSAGSSIATTQVAARNISCSSFGTAAGITCSLPRAGNYQVCNTALTGGANGTTVAIADGSGNLITQGAYWNASTAAGTLSQCGIYNASASGSNSFQLYLASTAGTGNISTGLGATTIALQWTILELDAPMPAPYLVGSVTSTTSGQEHIERAHIANTGTPSISDQSGSWINTSISHPSTGNTTLTINSGEFSAAPTCTCTSDASAANDVVCTLNGNATSTSIEIRTYAAGSAVDNGYYLICMGPR